MKKLGSHYIIELIHCNAHTLMHVTSVEQSLVHAAKESGATIINTHFHQFSPQGVSGVILIAESHFTIHTWPEEQYAAIDFFTCGSMIPEKAIAVLEKAFEAQRKSIQIIERGY